MDGAKDTHTITYKDTGTVLAPTLVRHIEETYKLKSKQKNKHGQDSFHDLVLDGAKDTHTITYKDTGTVLAPTLVRHIEETYKLKSKQKDQHRQTLMSEFKYMVENEAPNDEGKSRAYLSIPQCNHKRVLGKIRTPL